MVDAVESLRLPGPAPAAPEGSPYKSGIVNRIDDSWDSLVGGFSDVCLEQTASYMGPRWGSARLCGLTLQSALSGEVEAAALAVTVTVPLLRAGLAYVKFGPLTRRHPSEPLRPNLLTAALRAIKRELSERRGLVTRIMPSAEPEYGSLWTASLAEAGFRARAATEHPERYLVDLSLSEYEQLKSLGAKWRANLRKVDTSVSVREADPIKELPLFLDLYSDMRDRKNFADHHHVEQLTAFMAKASMALSPRLFVAEANGHAVAASIIVGSGERAYVPYSATSAEALPLRAGYALRWEIMNRLRGTPAKWLDLGGDEGDQGLRHFKIGNVGSRGRIVPIPGEYEASGSALSIMAASALELAHRASRARIDLMARLGNAR